MNTETYITSMFRPQLDPAHGMTFRRGARQAVKHHARLLRPVQNNHARAVAYLPPFKQAGLTAAGSPHGYDIVAECIADYLGGEAEFAEFANFTHSLGLLIFEDCVPNHRKILWQSIQDVINGADLITVSGNQLWDGVDVNKNAAQRNEFFDLVVDVVRKLRFTGRFFDVDDLVRICVENPKVFDMVMGGALDRLEQGLIDGLRIDHPDGLTHPVGYLTQLSTEAAQRNLRRQNPLKIHGLKRGQVPIYVEKISKRRVEGPFPVPFRGLACGDTGYDNFIVDKAWSGSARAQRLWHRTYTAAVGREPDDAIWERVAKHGRQLVAISTQRPELNLMCRLYRDCIGDPPMQNTDLEAIRIRIAAALMAPEVYRIYIDPVTFKMPRQSRNIINRAVKQGKIGREIADILLGKPLKAAELAKRGLTAERYADLQRQFIGRFQVTAAANMGMGEENTGFYRYLCLLAANEVGGDPSQLVVPFSELHNYNEWIQKNLPLQGRAIATHDSKWGWYSRATGFAMLEFAAEYCRELWPLWRDQYIHLLRDGVSDNEASKVLWQLLQILIMSGLGVNPISFKRVKAYIVKALCEAKRFMRGTHWCQRNGAWERRVLRTASAMWQGTKKVKPLTADPLFLDFVRRVDEVAMRNANRTLLVTWLAPGVPIMYQYDTVRERQLVDPDNRRRVNWAARERLLDRALAGDICPETERMELHRRCAKLRCEEPEVFGPDSKYQRKRCARGIAFTRTYRSKTKRVRLHVYIGCKPKKLPGKSIFPEFSDFAVCVEQLA